MLNKQAIDEINQALQEGSIGAALAPLEAAVDVRWNELPRLEKTTLAAFAAHLRQDESVASASAEAFFHTNISVRRFARKLVQSLKDKAVPLAKPLRARIEVFLRESRALPYSFERDEAARRREQADILEGAVETLRRCDVNELLDWQEELSQVWHPLLQERRELQQQHLKKVEPLHQQIQRRTEELFEEKFGHLKLKMNQVYAVPRLQREYRQALETDPALIDLNEQVQALNAALANPEQTLLQEMFTVQHIFARELDSIVGRKAKPSEETARLRSRLWQWIEDGLRGNKPGIESVLGYSYSWPQWLDGHKVREQALPLLAVAKSNDRTDSTLWMSMCQALRMALFPQVLEQDGVTALPPSLTPEAARALKTGEQWQDNIVEGIAYAIEEWQAKQESEPQHSIQAVPGYIRVSDKSLRQFIEQLVTPEARAEALVSPPIIEPGQAVSAYNELRPIMRHELINLWSQSPDWNESKTALAEIVLPRLWQRFRQQLEAYQNLRKRGGKSGGGKADNAKANPDSVESTSDGLTERELSALRSATRQQERWEVERDLAELYMMILEFGGNDQQLVILDALDITGLKDMQNNYINWIFSKIAQGRSVEASTLPFVLAAHARWERNQEGKTRNSGRLNRDQDEWQVRGHYGSLAHVLYCIGTPESVAQARDALAKSGIAPYAIARLAKERRDYDMLLPLVRNWFYHVTIPDLVELWDDLRQAQPERVPVIAGELLQMLAEATEENQTRVPLQLLASLDGQADLWSEHAAAIARLQESTLPSVVRFAFTRLTSLLDESLDWSYLCEIAGEKLWSEKPGLAKDAARFLGQAGARHEEAAPIAWQALCDALSLQSLPLLELVLRALWQIKSKQSITLAEAARERIEELKNDQPRLSRLCERLLPSN